MASNYSLQLQATLDTRQVQQELNRLREAQLDAAGSSDGKNGGGSGYAGNFRQLNATLQTLNKSVNQLAAAVNRLNARDVSARMPFSGDRPMSPVPPPVGNNSNRGRFWTGDFTQGIVENEVRAAVKNVIAKNDA